MLFVIFFYVFYVFFGLSFFFVLFLVDRVRSLGHLVAVYTL